MKTENITTEEQVIDDKMESLIAIGAATAVNCIPCFENLFEKAINSGNSIAEIKMASKIASNVKAGAHKAIMASAHEVMGIEKNDTQPSGLTENKACCK